MTSILDTPSTTEEITSYKDLLVGEGKKFSDDEALARGKYESDKFVDQLQRELRELRQDLDARANLQDLVTKISSGTSNVTPPGNSESRQGETPNPPATVSKDDIAAIVKSVVMEDKTLDQRNRNISACAEELRKVHGDNYASKLKDTIRSLGLSEQYIDELAATSPKAVVALMGSPAQKVNVEAPRSSIMSTTSSHKSSGGKDWSYYQNLRKSDPRTYYSPAVQMEIHKRAMNGDLTLP